MMLLSSMATLILHAALMLAAAPLVTGLVRRIKARLLGRAGPPIIQPWRDLIRLAGACPLDGGRARAAPAQERAARAGRPGPCA